MRCHRSINPPGTTYVTDITASSNGSDVLTSAGLADGTAELTVAAGDTTNQTIVTYTDALLLKESKQ